MALFEAADEDAATALDDVGRRRRRRARGDPGAVRPAPRRRRARRRPGPGQRPRRHRGARASRPTTSSPPPTSIGVDDRGVTSRRRRRPSAVACVAGARRRRVRRRRRAPGRDPDLGGDTTAPRRLSRNALAFPAPNLTHRRAPAVRGRRQLLHPELGDRAGVHRRPRRARPDVQRPGVLVVPRARRSRRAARPEGIDDAPRPAAAAVRARRRRRPARPAAHPVYGGQLQDRAILGVPGRGADRRRRCETIDGDVRRRHALHADASRPTRSPTRRSGRSATTR